MMANSKDDPYKGEKFLPASEVLDEEEDEDDDYYKKIEDLVSNISNAPAV